MALPDSFRLEAATSRTSGIASQTVADGATFTGSSIDNASNLDEFLNVELVYSYGTAPTASKTVNLYLLYSVDGTNYADVSKAALLGSFSPAADTSSHREVRVKGWPLLPFAFKIAIENVDTGQTITVTANASTHSGKIID